MKRIAKIGYWAVLGIPALAALIVMGVEHFMLCEINPYNGLTCPRVVVLLMPFAVLGLVTMVPFFVIGAIWLLFAFWMYAIRARR